MENNIMGNSIKTGRQHCGRDQSGDARSERMERCVLCWRMTDVPKTMPVARRKGYIEGAGQLCKSCCYELLKSGAFFCDVP